MGNQLIIPASKFGLTIETLKFLSDSIKLYTEAIGTLAGFRSIITGVNVYTNPPSEIEFLTDGYISYNGELLFFQGGQKYDHVQIVTEVIERPYLTSGGQVPMPAYQKKYAKSVPAATGVSFLFSQLTKLKTVKEITDLFNDNPQFTQALLLKLNGIQDGAEVNVQADWNVVGPESDAFIKNKPTNLTRRVIGSFNFPGSAQSINGMTITHNLNTLNYSVVAEVQCIDGTNSVYNTYAVTTYEKTLNSFKAAIRKIDGVYPGTVKLTLNALY